MRNKTLFAYDEIGNLIAKSLYASDGQLLEEESHEFEYDAFDNLVSENHRKFFSGWEGSFETSEYSGFDTRGNWQKKTLFKHGAVQFIFERKIEYYDGVE